ncbi:hypothetical protein BC938DRAFT_479785 [Jimgerdemannia flammicorona]|uniref:Uncharacterized protein n=1 Tax=Jimgerdemannia flammicorona TaxID=994334 RepID=A0A433QK60_9FUNG|nr:hypothetical protein BC938DRAFT_479785 [Jimgerdemannia flammicorona]
MMISMFNFALAVATGVLITVSSVNAMEKNTTNPLVPPQGPSRLTGYPTWHGLESDWNLQELDAVTLWSVLGTTFAVGLAIFSGHLRDDDSNLTPSQRTVSLFDRVLGGYTIATLISVVAFAVLDLGKLWSPLGAVHNLLEVTIILVFLFHDQWDRMIPFLFYFQLAYITITVLLSIALPWPLDALVFKIQGLAQDFALPIIYTRLFFANREAEHLRRTARNGETTNLLANDENAERGDFGESAGDESDERRRETADILILIVAASIHALGNVITTLLPGFVPFATFQFTYGVVYPLYGFYVYRQPIVPSTQFQWVKISVPSELLVGIVSIILSIITTVVGLFLSSRKM